MNELDLQDIENCGSFGNYLFKKRFELIGDHKLDRK